MDDKDRFVLAVLISALVVVADWSIISYYLRSKQRFGVYLLENDELVISNEDILSYNWTSHEIKLNQKGMERIRTLDLVRKPFVTKLNGRTIHNGSFWSDIFSDPYYGIAMTDILAVQHGSTDTLKLEPCYPPQFCQDVDPRNRSEILDHFQGVGKLVR